AVPRIRAAAAAGPVRIVANVSDRSKNWLGRACRRFARHWVKRPLVRLALAVLPAIYLGYMRFVWWTSRIDDEVGPVHGSRGGLVVARECAKPVVLVRTWAKRCLRVPTWDRMAIPLPWNRIRRAYRGPFFAPEGADTPEKLEPFRLEMERELAELAAESYRW